MNYLDLILIIPLVWAAYKGFTKGLIFSAASLIALVLGIYGAIHFSIFAEAYINEWIEINQRYLTLIAFIVTFLVIIIAVHLLAFFLDRIIKAVALGIVNRLAGVIFNLVKVAFILSIILSIINFYDSYNPFIPQEKKEESILYGPVSAFAPSIFPYFNLDELRERYGEGEILSFTYYQPLPLAPSILYITPIEMTN